ncbi:polymerase II polypeptide E [Salpingoeca rosetta]|uniref:Polymerase II polypeptide E n=1 Tax=Salpingoeca rosetta (strain ATCC 50818 / BSB-021) TaxID=946362 RepID=F2UGE2_SALR5|nr:polymerase II polypeptide E [Salpingoeca rosetta]EGD75692.1 polymerase II polypeptide E [Salpingoeca rosetta]|eukprot:XP_004991613.1 polymerase II polypeptide E [Salpingoeca rosetta]
MDVERLRRAYNTTVQLCSDRGYSVPHTEVSKTEFEQRFGSDPRPSELDSVFAHKKDEQNRIAIFWADDLKIGISKVKEYLDKLTQQGINAGIIVAQAKLTPSASKAVRDAASAGITVQVFDITELIVNITRHELVPQHVVLSKEEKQALLQRYKLQEQQLPRMKVSDPVARYLGLKRGQVCKVIRNNSPTAGRYVSYRIVF